MAVQNKAKAANGVLLLADTRKELHAMEHPAPVAWVHIDCNIQRVWAALRGVTPPDKAR